MYHESVSGVLLLMSFIGLSRFLGSLRARLKQLHPSANCSLRDDHMVHVHFKEEIGIAELIPLVTTYIILFAYIYFSTRESTSLPVCSVLRLVPP